MTKKLEIDTIDATTLINELIIKDNPKLLTVDSDNDESVDEILMMIWTFWRRYIIMALCKYSLKDKMLIRKYKHHTIQDAIDINPSYVDWLRVMLKIILK